MFSDISLLPLPLCLSPHVDRRHDKIQGLLAIGINYRLLDYRHWYPFCPHYRWWTESHNGRPMQLPLVVALSGRYFFRFFLISYYSESVLVLILIATLLEVTRHERAHCVA